MKQKGGVFKAIVKTLTFSPVTGTCVFVEFSRVDTSNHSPYCVNLL